MPSGVQYKPAGVSPALTEDILLAYIQNLLVAYCTAQGITMPSGPQYSPVGVSPALPQQILLTYIQNLLAALVAGGGGGGGGTVVQGGTKALVAGQQDSYTVTFATPFASTPKLAFGVIKSGNAGGNIFVTGYTVTTTGFTFDLSGDPGAGATMNYLATQ
jgi:hypothetical protein